MRSRIGSSMSLSIALVAAMTLTSGCAIVRSRPCVPVVEYDDAFLDRAIDERALLPKDGAVETMLADYAVMRDMARACGN